MLIKRTIVNILETTEVCPVLSLYYNDMRCIDVKTWEDHSVMKSIIMQNIV